MRGSSGSPSNSLTSQSGYSSRSRLTSEGRNTVETLWNVPMSMRPSPAWNRSTALVRSSAPRSS